MRTIQRNWTWSSLIPPSLWADLSQHDQRFRKTRPWLKERENLRRKTCLLSCNLFVGDDLLDFPWSALLAGCLKWTRLLRLHPLLHPMPGCLSPVLNALSKCHFQCTLILYSIWLGHTSGSAGHGGHFFGFRVASKLVQTDTPYQRLLNTRNHWNLPLLQVGLHIIIRVLVRSFISIGHREARAARGWRAEACLVGRCRFWTCILDRACLVMNYSIVQSRERSRNALENVVNPTLRNCHRTVQNLECFYFLCAWHGAIIKFSDVLFRNSVP